jgi:hypothetical protein
MKIMIVDGFWTVICITVSSVLILLAFLVTRSKIRSINRFEQTQAKGGFTKLNKPEYKSKTRHFALIALTGLLGMVLSIAIVIFQQISGSTNFSDFTAIIALLFGILSSVGGFLMKREIDRRL